MSAATSICRRVRRSRSAGRATRGRLTRPRVRARWEEAIPATAAEPAAGTAGAAAHLPGEGTRERPKCWRAPARGGGGGAACPGGGGRGGGPGGGAVILN